MFTDKQLDQLLEIFLQRVQSVNEEYLIRMGEQIKDIGELIPSAVNRLVQFKRMNANLDAVKREIARLAEISAEDMEKVLIKAMETDARFVARTFGNEYKPSILENPMLVQILWAQLNVTLGEFANLSRTTISSEAYKSAVDKAISAAQSGVEDYNKAVRRALTEAAEAGIRTQIGHTGAHELRVGYGGKYTRRLDSAVRMNVLDGIRSLSNDVLWQLGEEFGADGVEISAHATCAEDHLPYQGRQYSLAAFEALQEKLDRPFGLWNCRHSMHPILLGVSEPAYSEEELEDFKRRSTEKITIDGVTKTRYQWTQEQRKIETAVRRQKDVAICAKASGDTKLRRRANDTINALYERYEKISEQAGLSKSFVRLRVDGYKPMSKRELRDETEYGTIRSYKDMLSARKRIIKTEGVRSLSMSGEPDSITDLLDESGITVLQRRIYDHSGRASVDFDTDDHKRPKLHPTGAHKHLFDYSLKRPRSGYKLISDAEIEQNSDIIQKGVNYHDPA